MNVRQMQRAKRMQEIEVMVKVSLAESIPDFENLIGICCDRYGVARRTAMDILIFGKTNTIM